MLINYWTTYFQKQKKKKKEIFITGLQTIEYCTWFQSPKGQHLNSANQCENNINEFIIRQ